MRTRAVPPVPASVVRDLTLYALRKHAPAVAASLVKSSVQYMPRKGVVRATFDYDPVAYARAVERKR